jgi:hypothetical protein
MKKNLAPLIALRNNRSAVFTAVPFCGAAVGSLVAEFLPNVLSGSRSSLLLTIIGVALWSAVISTPLTLALFWSDLIYRRGRLLNREIIRQALVTGPLAGAISGAIAQAVYSIDLGSGLMKHVVLRSLCWGIMGGLLGWRLSTRVPNLGSLRGSIAGVIGGILGGLGFVGFITIFPEFLGRMAGVGILGAALGLAIVTVEHLCRTASMKVMWGPRETTTITLAAKPVSIGGGDDHVWLKGLPPRAFLVWIERGKVFCKDQQTGKQIELKDGGTFTVARVQFQITASPHAQTGGTGLPPNAPQGGRLDAHHQGGPQNPGAPGRNIPPGSRPSAASR